MKFTSLHMSIVLFILIFSSSCHQIKYTDCGSGEVKSVDVVPCDADPCMFKRGETVNITAKEVPTKDAEKGELKVTVLVGGVEVDYPGVDPDMCKYVKCPMKKGQEYTASIRLKVEDYFPELTMTMKWKATGTKGEGTLMCAKTEVGIKK
jgi:hypothetical protein